MPHLEDDWFDLPEYPVRPVAPRGRAGAAGGRPASVWVRYPMGSRIVAALTVTLLLAPVVAFFRGGDGSGTASAAADTGLVVSDAADASAGMAADGSAALVSDAVAAASEGTLPGTAATAATLPRTTPTTPPATAAPRKTASQSSTVQVVKPPVTTKAPAKSTTSAKAVVKPATSKATKPTTAATAVVKPPATATTPRTTRPQAVATAAPAHEWTTDEVQALIRQMWPADSVDKALQVAARESRFRATVYNGWCCYGVFQINGSSHLHRLRARGLGVQDLLDPKVNIDIALELFQEQGWGPWGG